MLSKVMQRARAGYAYYRFPESDMSKRATLVSRDMICLVAFDFVLRIIFRRVMSMSFVNKIPGMDRDNRSRHATRFGIPTHVITDFEPHGHLSNFTIFL